MLHSPRHPRSTSSARLANEARRNIRQEDTEEIFRRELNEWLLLRSKENYSGPQMALFNNFHVALTSATSGVLEAINTLQTDLLSANSSAAEGAVAVTLENVVAAAIE